MKIKKRIWISVSAAVLLIVCTAALALYYTGDNYGFSRRTPPVEALQRLEVVHSAQEFLGCAEADGSHRKIIDLYNSHEPLARGYAVTYEDSWCAAFVSAVAIRCGMTDRIPTECGCERQIELFKNLQRWEESDTYTPLPGDIIYYAWDEKVSSGDCTGWADHVGIVVGTAWPFIKVIEGNFSDSVAYRCILMNHPEIRGYAIPNYS